MKNNQYSKKSYFEVIENCFEIIFSELESLMHEYNMHQMWSNIILNMNHNGINIEGSGEKSYNYCKDYFLNTKFYNDTEFFNRITFIEIALELFEDEIKHRFHSSIKNTYSYGIIEKQIRILGLTMDCCRISRHEGNANSIDTICAYINRNPGFTFILCFVVAAFIVDAILKNI